MSLNRWSTGCCTLIVILGGTYWFADGAQRLDPTACRNGLGSTSLPDRATYFYTATRWQRWPTVEPTFATPPETVAAPTPATTPGTTPGTSPGTQGTTPRAETPSTPRTPGATTPTPNVPGPTDPNLPFFDPTRPEIPPEKTEEMLRELDLNPPPTMPAEPGAIPTPFPTPANPLNPIPTPFPSGVTPPTEPLPSPATPSDIDDLFNRPAPRQGDGPPPPPREGDVPTSRTRSLFDDEIFQDERRNGNPFQDEPEPRTSSAPERPRQSSQVRPRDLQRDEAQPEAKWRIIADAPPEFPGETPALRNQESRLPLLPAPSHDAAEPSSPAVTFSTANPLRAAGSTASKPQRVLPAANWTAEPRASSGDAAARPKNPLRSH